MAEGAAGAGWTFASEAGQAPGSPRAPHRPGAQGLRTSPFASTRWAPGACALGHGDRGAAAVTLTHGHRSPIVSPLCRLRARQACSVAAGAKFSEVSLASSAIRRGFKPSKETGDPPPPPPCLQHKRPPSQRPLLPDSVTAGSRGRKALGSACVSLCVHVCARVRVCA